MPFFCFWTPQRLRLLKFCAVGTSGMFVNEFTLWLAFNFLFTGLAETETFLGANRLSWSGLIAIAISILTNFLLNDLWTWRDRKKKSGWRGFLLRLGQYYLIATAAGLVQWGSLKLFTESFGLHYLLSNILGILLGMSINFLANNLWTFRDRSGR